MALLNDVLRFYTEQNKDGIDELSPSAPQLVQDNVTPYKICTLIFIREYLETKDYGYSDDGSSIWYTDEERKAIMFTMMHLLKVPDLSLNDLRSLLSARIKTELMERFEQTLQQLLVGGISSIHSFFDRLNEPIKDKAGNDIAEFTLLNKTSVVGVFVRSMLISFKLMSFEEIINNVSLELDQYHKSSLSENTASTRQIKKAKPSKWQAERRITQLATLIEDNESEAGSPAEVSEELNDLLRYYPSLYRAHYVQYLNYMRILEYAGARDSLNQYFEKIVINEKSPFSDSELINKCCRYSSLSLASLYARFGHREQAMYSVKEAIKSAQESKDKECLRHTLIWLQHLQDETIPTVDIHDQQPNNTMVSLQPAYRMISISAAMINILKSAHLTDAPKRFFMELAKMKPPQSKDFLRRAQQVQSYHKSLTCSLWLHYDRRDMANLLSQTALRKSVSSINRSCEGECQVLCTLSNHHFYEGKYDQAEVLLSIAKNTFPRPYHNSIMWSLTEHCQLFDRAYYHLDAASMRLACDNLVALDPFEARLRQACLYRVKRCYHQSHKLLDELYKEYPGSSKTKSFISLQSSVRVLREMVELFCSMGDFNSAMKYILECIKMTKEHHLILPDALCHFYLAYIRMMFGDSVKAYSILKANLPAILISGNLFDRARAQLLYVKCKVATVSQQDQSLCIRESLKLLEMAEQSFQSCEAFVHLQDTLLYMALISNMVGDTDKRNLCAFKYKENQQNLMQLESSLSNQQFVF